jgi:hypothetical protein
MGREEEMGGIVAKEEGKEAGVGREVKEDTLRRRKRKRTWSGMKEYEENGRNKEEK